MIAFKPPATQLRKENRDWIQALKRLDPLGTVTFIAGVTCCLLAIQWGGSKYPWKDARTITLFILSGVLVTTFGFIETRMGNDALVPVHIVNRRSILASAFFVTCLGGVMYSYVYFFPIWFQAIKGVSAWQSGVMLIPFLLGVIFMSIIAGVGVTMIGYYAPPMIGTSIIMSIGAGLSTTLAVNSGHSKWIGYQALLGLGIGMGLQQPLICIQAVLPINDVPIGTGVIMFMQTFGGAIFLAVSNSVFLSRLTSGLSQMDGVSASTVTNTGATNLAQFGPVVKVIYNKALTQTWYVAVALSALSLCGAVLVEWRSVKAAKPVEIDQEKVESDQESLEERRSREEQVAGAVKRMHRHIRTVTPEIGLSRKRSDLSV